MSELEERLEALLRERFGELGRPQNDPGEGGVHIPIQIFEGADVPQWTDR